MKNTSIALIAGFASVNALSLNKSHPVIKEKTTQFAEVNAQETGWKPWKSGEVVSQETFQYGKFIARIKGENKLGTVTSFFSFFEGDDSDPWEASKWSEIDGVELVPSSEWGTMSTNIIFQYQDMNPSTINRNVANPTDQWNVYEFQWTPFWISFLFNGQEVRKVWRDDEPDQIDYMTRP